MIKSVPAYSNISKKFLFCLNKKLPIIAYRNQSELLNKRSELIAKCLIENNVMLVNYNSCIEAKYRQLTG